MLKLCMERVYISSFAGSEQRRCSNCADAQDGLPIYCLHAKESGFLRPISILYFYNAGDFEHCYKLDSVPSPDCH